MLRDKWTWTLFNDFLIATLDGAFSLAEVDCTAFSISKDLHFDVVTFGNKALNEQSGVYNPASAHCRRLDQTK